MSDSIPEALGALRVRLDAVDRAQRELDEQLVAARSAGATFAQLAATLGLKSAQAAEYRHRAAQQRIDRRQQR